MVHVQKHRHCLQCLLSPFLSHVAQSPSVAVEGVNSLVSHGYIKKSRGSVRGRISNNLPCEEEKEGLENNGIIGYKKRRDNQAQ